MLPVSRGLILDNNNYSIVKTETIFEFAPKNQDDYANRFNVTDPYGWLFTQGKFAPRSLQVSEDLNAPKELTKDKHASKKIKKEKRKEHKRKRRGKGKKCVFKVLKKGKRNRKRGKYKMHKKYVMPVILGLLAAKSLLIPIALKALAFVSAKGLMMGFFSTVMASVLSLKGMFENSHAYQNRKDDTKTQVEIIQVPTKTEDHVYYDEHYRRGDLAPLNAPRDNIT